MRPRSPVKTWLGQVIVGMVVTAGILVFLTPARGSDGARSIDFRAVFLFGTLTGTTIFLVQTFVFPLFQRFSFVGKLLMTVLTMILAFVVSGGLAMYFTIVLTLTDRRAPRAFQTGYSEWIEAVTHPRMGIIIGISLLVAAVLTWAAQIERKLGHGVLWNWMIGRYHRPRLEERIILFLDLRESTTLAERLGDLEFSALVKAFIADVGTAIECCDGEISHYIGDEIVATWHPRKGLKRSACLVAIQAAEEAIRQRSARYQSRFGLTPTFKAALHIGSVVATEVGTGKSEIVFHGDAMNTTARLQNLCDEIGCHLITSAELANRLEPLPHLQPLPVREVQLKGKERPVAVVAWVPNEVSVAIN